MTGSPDTLCDWKLVDDKATHVSGDPLMVLKIDQSLADEAQLTVGPFTNLTLPHRLSRHPPMALKVPPVRGGRFSSPSEALPWCLVPLLPVVCGSGCAA